MVATVGFATGRELVGSDGIGMVGCLTGWILLAAAARLVTVGVDEGGEGNNEKSTLGCLTGGINVATVGETCGDARIRAGIARVFASVPLGADSDDVGCFVS